MEADTVYTVSASLFFLFSHRRKFIIIKDNATCGNDILAFKLNYFHFRCCVRFFHLNHLRYFIRFCRLFIQIQSLYKIFQAFICRIALQHSIRIAKRTV